MMHWVDAYLSLLQLLCLNTKLSINREDEVL